VCTRIPGRVFGVLWRDFCNYIKHTELGIYDDDITDSDNEENDFWGGQPNMGESGDD